MPTIETLVTNELQIPAGHVWLPADLVIPADAIGLVAFAHGSGSSRHSERNRFVAGQLHDAGIATLLADLLTKHEEEIDEANGRYRFDIAMLANRVVEIIDWVANDKTLSRLPLGLFGASTGGAAALDAAADRPKSVRAVVSRGGRPDLASHLTRVHAPTLLIVGGGDDVVLRLNQQALRTLACTRRLDVIPGATHLFEEPGCLERVATLARAWFEEYLK